mmetsp:Transcript_2008/g.4549  ORF Transcript_2008/g.4549 Transcript_2008/m.4549 type:complete len:201 (+) Transcript_2008:268-870(+)
MQSNERRFSPLLLPRCFFGSSISRSRWPAAPLVPPPRLCRHRRRPPHSAVSPVVETEFPPPRRGFRERAPLRRLRRRFETPPRRSPKGVALETEGASTAPSALVEDSAPMVGMGCPLPRGSRRLGRRRRRLLVRIACREPCRLLVVSALLWDRRPRRRGCGCRRALGAPCRRRGRRPRRSRSWWRYEREEVRKLVTTWSS